MKLYSLLLMLAFLSSCQKEVTVQDQKPRPVIVQAISEPILADHHSYSGVTKATGLATLSFEQGGRITQLIAKKGLSYKKGDLLAVLDLTNLSSDLLRAEAESTKSNEELKRVQQLYESGNASKSDFDAAIANQRSQSAALQIAQNKVNQGNLIMPYSGIIEDVLVDEQNVVSAGTSILKIQAEGGMEVEVSIPVSQISSIQLGMLATITIPSLSQETILAETIKISPQASANATFPITLKLEDYPKELRGGVDTEVEFEFPNPNSSLSAEVAAVIGSMGSNYVWIITPTVEGLGKASKRTVTTGSLMPGGRIEILSGLTVGELIVTRGANSIQEGHEVLIQR